MPDPRDLNLDELDDVVRSAFQIRHEPPQSDDVVRSHSRIVKGLLMVDTTIAAMAVPIATQKIVDAYIEGGR